MTDSIILYNKIEIFFYICLFIENKFLFKTAIVNIPVCNLYYFTTIGSNTFFIYVNFK